MKRAPPRSAPPLGREEMLMIKKKVAPPKGPPPSSIEGFKPKSISSSSSSSRSHDDYYRESTSSGRYNTEMETERSSRNGPYHSRPAASRYDYDDDDDEDYRKTDTRSSRHDVRGSRDERWDRNERDHNWEREDNRARYDSEKGGDRWDQPDSRSRYEGDYDDDDRAANRRPMERYNEAKSESDDDSEGKTESPIDKKDTEPPRMARNGRDRIYNFRSTVLHANYKQLRTFVRTPCAAGVVIRCYIERTRSIGKNYMSPSYSLCADMEDGSGKELIICRKMFKSKTPHYVFSMRESDLYRKRRDRSRVYLGKLRSVSANEYVMFDSGSSERKDSLRPGDIRALNDSDDGHADEDEEKEQANTATEDALYKSQLCSIFYHTKTRPTSGLGMEVCVPTVASKSNPVQGDLRTDLVECFKCIREEGQQNELFANKCFIMQEKKSKYDPLSSCLVDFQGRASVASVKNFQLLESTPFRLGERPRPEKASDDEIIFQLGKISEDCFNMDFMYPLSMIQAFAIAISRFDAKISW